MEYFASIAPMIGLLFFFAVFIVIAVWVLLPSKKHQFQSQAAIPLKEDRHGRS